MHAPRSYGLFAPDELSNEDRQAIESLARQLTNFKTISQLPSLKRSITLNDGRIATAIDMGGLFRVLVSDKDAQLPERLFDGLAHGVIPMLFSGVVNNALPVRKAGVELTLTEWTRRRLIHYKTGDKNPLPSKKQQLLRFEIDYPKQLEHLKLKRTGIYRDTQYFKMRPSWHSGAICEVVQAVAGFGRQYIPPPKNKSGSGQDSEQREDELPDDPIERAQMVLPDDIAQKIEHELKGFRLPAYTGFVPENGQFQYSYIARECDGVGFGVDGMAWLLKIHASGVFAMPLPLIPATTTIAFREYMEEVGDIEILHLLNRFGGLPSGETFPKDNDLAVWQRAGVVIKICDSDFFQYSPMFDAGGFSFNLQGSEAFNTCFEYDDDGMMWVYGYKLRLKLSKCESRLGYLADDLETKLQGLTDNKKILLNNYLSGILKNLSVDAVGLAIRYKLRRATAQELLSRAELKNKPEQEQQYWDTLNMKPIATHSGSLNRVSSGKLYAFTQYLKAIRGLKFPTLDGKGCASFPHDMEFFIKNGGIPPQKCDTLVFGCYVGDTLRTIHYFYDERKFQKSEVSTFEEPMIIGQWERTITQGETGLVGQFYTTDWDDRTEIAPTVIHEVVTGRDLGYGQPAYHTPPVLYRVGTVSRARYFTTTTETHTTTGGGLSVAVCVPVYGRDCIQYAKTEFSHSQRWEKHAFRDSRPDPTSYQMWTHDSAFHFMGVTKEGNKGDPPPKDGKPVYVDSEIYAPYEYSDYADSGGWHGTVSDITAIVGQYTARGSMHVAGGVVVGGEAPHFDEYHHTKTENGKATGCLNMSCIHADGVQVHQKIPHNWYFDVSPIQSGADLSYFWRDCCVNFNGVEYTNIDEMKTEKQRHHWGKSQLADNTQAHFFIGVVYE